MPPCVVQRGGMAGRRSERPRTARCEGHPRTSPVLSPLFGATDRRTNPWMSPLMATRRSRTANSSSHTSEQVRPGGLSRSTSGGARLAISSAGSLKDQHGCLTIPPTSKRHAACTPVNWATKPAAPGAEWPEMPKFRTRSDTSSAGLRKVESSPKRSVEILGTVCYPERQRRLYV
jgi:hypothetical protein